jgi:hypothetical protein
MSIRAITLVVICSVAVVFGQSMLVHTKGSATPATYALSTVDSITFDLSTLLPIHDPVAALSFNDSCYNHNMHIASDGTYLYTINGGNVSVGLISKYTLSGTLVGHYPILIDGRGLSYNKADASLYASTYGGNIVKITNLAAGTFSTVYTAKMANAQASFAISPDGSKFYDFSLGTVKVYSMSTGTLLSTITGLSYGAGNYGGEACIAVDDTYMYTWNATTKTVYVYTLAGTAVRTLTLANGDNGQSLAVFDGMLFVSKDGNYSLGTWYGYNIRKPIALAKQAVVTAAPVAKSAVAPDANDTSKK